MIDGNPRASVHWLAVVGWTIGTAVVQAVGLWGLWSRSDVASGVGINVAFFGSVVVGVGLMRTAPVLERIVPVLAGTGLALGWPIVTGWRADNDDLFSSAVVSGGFCLAIAVVTAAFTVAVKRRWIHDSPVRRILVFAFFGASGLSKLFGWPTGVALRVFSLVVLSATMIALFWPAKNDSSSPGAHA